MNPPGFKLHAEPCESCSSCPRPGARFGWRRFRIESPAQPARCGDNTPCMNTQPIAPRCAPPADNPRVMSPCRHAAIGPSVGIRRRSFLGVAAVLLLVATATTCNAADTAAKRLLIVGQGSDGHPSTTHEFMAGTRVLSELLAPMKS